MIFAGINNALVYGTGDYSTIGSSFTMSDATITYYNNFGTYSKPSMSFQNMSVSGSASEGVTDIVANNGGNIFLEIYVTPYLFIRDLDLPSYPVTLPNPFKAPRLVSQQYVSLVAANGSVFVWGQIN